MALLVSRSPGVMDLRLSCEATGAGRAPNSVPEEGRREIAGVLPGHRLLEG